MRLTQLNPQWIDLADFKKVGVIFDCPVHGRAGCTYPRIPAYFANPPSGAQPLAKHDPDEGRWIVTGSGFEDMTLTPSILYPMPKYGPQHWHGFVTNGEVT